MKLLIFSDIHGDKAALERLMKQEADYYFCAGDLANWGKGLDALGPVMQPHADRVYVIPGNHESDHDIADFCERFGFHNLHGRSMRIGEHIVAALGYSNPTPFNTPGEYSEQELASRLSEFDDLKPEILICHCPPKSTKLDQAGEGQHFGSQAVRDFIEKNQPRYFYCGHIHEAAGASEHLGQTQGFNVGKQGRSVALDVGR